MKLSELLKNAHIRKDQSGPDPDIRGIEYDSRCVNKGDLFVAIKGYRSDGHRFISQAVHKGAHAVVCEKEIENQRVPVIQVANSRKSLAYLSQTFYHTGSLPFKLTGITGTNGKTTVTLLIRFLEEFIGLKAASLGTLGFIAPFFHSIPDERTTPESRDLHKLFHHCRLNGLQTLAIEVSSIALDLYRVENIVFDAAVFTNLSLDHLDFHHTMDRYFAAKVRLFNQLAHDGTAFINIDDAFGHKLYDSLDRKKRSCSIGNSEADYSYTTLHLSEKGMQGSIKTPGGMITTEAPLLGRFNAMNLLQAIAVWKEYHPDIILNHFDLTDLNPLPGRMEMIRTKSHGTVIIDYAHTPDAIKNILKSIHDIPHHATTVVFGCGGDRDKSKRPDMGRIVESYADRIILTNDNPRSENPDHIIRDIRKGLSEKSGLEIMTDRFAAIHQALSESTPEDVILLLGKGAEEYMEIQGRKIPCNDKEIVLSWIKKNEN